MAVLTFSLSDVRTRSELAARLVVPVQSLDLVSLSNSTICRNAGCSLPAALNNQHRCILCRQTWFPRELTANGEKSAYCRGHGLYGPQFLREYGGATSKKACCCTLPLCEKIGYSHMGMMRLPPNRDHCIDATTVLGIEPARRQQIAANPRSYMVAPWHYNPRHRKWDEKESRWTLRQIVLGKKYIDDDKKKIDYPPPNYNVQLFIENEIPASGYSRGGYNDSLPSWLKVLVSAQDAAQDAAQPRIVRNPELGTPHRSTGNKSRRVAAVATPTSTPRPPNRKRQSPESIELGEVKEELRILNATYQNALEYIESQKANIALKEAELSDVKKKLSCALEENTKLQKTIEAIQRQKRHISYDDLMPGGILSAFVKDFTFFPDFDCNEAFLEILNFAEECEPGNGLCENLCRYSKVSVSARKEYNDTLRASRQSSSGGDDGDDDMSTTSDAGTGLTNIGDAGMNQDSDTTKRRGPQRKLHWKTEYFVYCFYVRCNLSMRRVGALFGVTATLVHDIVYAWANFLCDALEQMFPVPTRSQMLRAYPTSHIKKFGHAQIMMLLDATEGRADTASMKTVNAILYSAYKHHSTLKWLVGCDPIGTVWNSSISDGHGGSISDPMFTLVSNILEQIPFGCAVEVDKGFLIENMCALLGVNCIRPMKLLDKQKQQSKEDVALTQKVGKTRIPIEQANGQMKQATAFFDRNIRVDQIGLADLIFRSSYLLTNFKLGFIQDRDDEVIQSKGRPCKAEIRWYGATDDGLIDIRPVIDLWGTDKEIKRWHELRDLTTNSHLSDTEISELVLEEDWPSKERHEHLRIIGV